MREDITDEDLDRLNDVRKRIWTGGYAGFILGGVWGLGNCVLYKVVQSKAVKYFPEHPVIKTMPRLQNKHLVMWSLVAGATGMFLGAGMQGMRGNESLRDIYERNTSDEGKDEHQVSHSRNVPGVNEAFLSIPYFAIVRPYLCAESGITLDDVTCGPTTNQNMSFKDIPFTNRNMSSRDIPSFRTCHLGIFHQS